MQKALSLLLAAALLMGLLVLPVSAEQVVVNSVTSREELKTQSTLYEINE